MLFYVTKNIQIQGFRCQALLDWTAQMMSSGLGLPPSLSSAVLGLESLWGSIPQFGSFQQFWI